MAEYTIKTYNDISPLGLAKLPKHSYSYGPKVENPDAIILRSFKLSDALVDSTVIAVARAGAGVNNIPLNEMTGRGIVVFNTPGANANAVKELVLAGMLLSSRNIVDASSYVKHLSGSDDELAQKVEDGKKKFQGAELSSKTLGVIGMGAIGYRVANLAVELGMKVVGYDPAMTVRNAWQVSSEVEQVNDIEEVLRRSDFVTIHVPLLEATRGLISKQKLAKMKSDATLLNFSRDQIVDEDALISALDANKLGKYVTDFPNSTTKDHSNVIALPHLGASTQEAEDECAIMAAVQLNDFLLDGNITNSVNFPSVSLKRTDGARLTIAHYNEPGMLNHFTAIMIKYKLNVADILNNNRGSQAYTIIDLDILDVPAKLLADVSNLDHVQIARVLKLAKNLDQ